MVVYRILGEVNMVNPLKIAVIAGTRPNLVKISSILRACQKRDKIKTIFIHTGQHYSYNMNQSFMEDLEIPPPDINLNVGSLSPVLQISEIMKRLEKAFIETAPDLVVVVGDVNSTVASALAAVKMGIKVAHVEAGLRSFDRGMPEEINRIITDSVSDVLFATEKSGVDNLKREGICHKKIHLVGNVMIDTLEYNRVKAEKSKILEKLKLFHKEYVVLTLHRPSNVDTKKDFIKIINAVVEIQKNIKVIFPAHPRTFETIEEIGLKDKLFNLKIVEPMGYLDFLKLLSHSKVVITDSGGIQEETTIFGVPCITARNNTERPITINEGTNILAGTETKSIANVYVDICKKIRKNTRPYFWDGKASDRIVKILMNIYRE